MVVELTTLAWGIKLARAFLPTGFWCTSPVQLVEYIHADLTENNGD